MGGLAANATRVVGDGEAPAVPTIGERGFVGDTGQP